METKVYFSKIDGQTLLLIEGEKGIIVSDKELIHVIYMKDEINTAEYNLPVTFERKEDGETYYLSFGYKTIPLKSILKKSPRMIGESKLKKFIHYFGIKSRIHGNYTLLQNSAKEINARVIWPDWNR